MEKQLATIDEVLTYKDTPSVTWINIDGLHEIDIIEKIGQHFHSDDIYCRNLRHEF